MEKIHLIGGVEWSTFWLTTLRKSYGAIPGSTVILLIQFMGVGVGGWGGGWGVGGGVGVGGWNRVEVRKITLVR